jgi:hypothetical protein
MTASWGRQKGGPSRGAELLKSAEIPATDITEANVYMGLSPKIIAETSKF